LHPQYFSSKGLPRLGAETLLYKNRWERRGSVELLAQALLVGGVEQGRERQDDQRPQPKVGAMKTMFGSLPGGSAEAIREPTMR
jgi:hypothetical protein